MALIAQGDQLFKPSDSHGEVFICRNGLRELRLECIQLRAVAVLRKAGAVDMAFTSGVLIHIHPDQLPASIEEIHRVARRYIVCIEYFSDKPEMIPYRGHDDRLFKRDFGGLYLDRFPDLQLLDYGFAWKRVTGLDNLTWWLFEKRP